MKNKVGHILVDDPLKTEDGVHYFAREEVSIPIPMDERGFEEMSKLLTLEANQVFAKRLAEGLNLKMPEALARVEVLLDRMRKDPELHAAFEEVSSRLGVDGIVTDVYRDAENTIQVGVVPVVPGWKQLDGKVAAMFMRGAQDSLRREVGEFELERIYPRGGITALPMLRQRGIR